MTTEEMLNQLRDKYQRAIEKYGKRLFSEVELESRITHLLQTSGNAVTFLEGEMEFFETLKKKAEIETLEQKSRDEFNSRIEKMVEENFTKIKKYPDAYFDPRASKEVRHFTGGITAILDDLHEVLKKNFGGSIESKELENILYDMERFYIKEGNPPTMLLKHYLEEVSMNLKEGPEKSDRTLMQTGGLLLYRLDLSLQKLVQNMPSRRLAEKAVISNKLANYQTLTGKTVAELAEYASKRCKDLLDDFRINDLVRHAYRNL